MRIFTSSQVTSDEMLMLRRLAAFYTVCTTMDKNDPAPTTAFDPPAEALWHRMIAEAAYYRARSQEFAAQSALEHWLAAEDEIKLSLTGRSTEVTHPKGEREEVVPDGGFEKSAAIDRQVPSPGKDVEKQIGEKMPDRK